MNELVVTLLIIVVALWTLSLAATSLALTSTAARSALHRASQGLLIAGTAVLAGLVAWMWHYLDRPPLRTLGETRLWYALMLPPIGLLLEWRLRTVILRIPMLLFGVLFLSLNLIKPDALQRELMPALQSPWFVPHVIAYIVSYAALGLSCGAAVVLLIMGYARGGNSREDLFVPSVLVHLGLPCLTLGLVFGGLWAKEAWGHYWTWDPKETWAFLSWAAYVAIIHVELRDAHRPRRTLWVIALSFLVVLGCWFLLNYLPATSIHKYSG